MTKRISLIVIMALAVLALLQCNVFAAETLPEAVDGVITLTEDVELTGLIQIDSSVTVNLNGHNITRSTAGDGKVAFWVANDNAVLTITGTGTVSAHGPAVWVSNGKAILEGGTYDSLESSTIYATTVGSIEILGGNYKNTARNTDSTCFVLNLRDSERETTSIIVKGGEFLNWNPADNEAELANTSFVQDGYSVVKDGDWYKVQKLNPAKIIDGETVTLNENITANGCDGAIYAKNGANVTITGGAIHAQICGDKHVTNGKLGEYAMAVWADGSKVTIKGGTFTNDADPYTPAQTDLIYVKNGGEVVIEGGEFKSSTPQWTLNSNDTNKGTITVKGGKFYQFDPSNANVGEGEIIVPEEYTVVKNGEWYEVVCAHKNLTKVDAKAATYTAEGNIEYYTCSCGKWFYDAAATSVISSKLAVITPMLIVVENNNANVSEGAVNEAIKDSEGSTNVEIPVLEADKAVSTVTVPVSSLNELATSNKGLLVETSEVTLTVDSTAVEKIAEQAGSATTITIEVIKVEEKVLNADQKDAIKNKDVAVILSAKILANGKEISNFGGGKIKVEIPFTPAEGTNGSDYKLIYITDDGKVEEIKSKYVDGVLVAELEHFSEYAIVKDAKTVSGTGSSSAASAPAAAASSNEKDDTPKTGAISLIGLVVVMSVIGLAVLKRD